MAHIFMTRITLREPQENDYELLHDLMFEEGFTKTVKHEGTEYKLPRGEYFLKDDLTRMDVYTKARLVLEQIITSKFEITITGREGVLFNGLDPVEE